MNRLLCIAILILSAALAAGKASAQSADLKPLIAALAVGNFADREKAVAALAATGDPAAVPALNALAEGDLYAHKSDKAVVIAKKAPGRSFSLTDPLTGADLGTVNSREVSKVKVNNGLRRSIRTALAGLTLMSPDRNIRLTAADGIFKAGQADSIEALDAAIAAEQDAEVKTLMQEARAVAVLSSELPAEAKTEALDILALRGDRDALSVILGFRPSAGEELSAQTDAAIARIEGSLANWEAAQNIWYGISLGSVLLLAAIGLAITFGVMGVINMAHGEMVMLGAYTTFVVQEFIRNSAPALFDYSLAIALPLAFLVSASVGLCIERGIIRHLYGRPLETLLATWGLSLVLQQAVRTIFGPTNREVGNPEWMSGAFEIGHMTITYNRMWIILFSLLVFGVLLLVLRKTSFGLQMRAVTQNRAMAASMGIRTPWIDGLTFALGSGVAGLAGVALSQIDNVSPNLGQGYIIDSFMVVVFGGVGNLWGTFVGAMTLGVVNKFLEPYAGAVLGKILVLVFIILFIQKRPRGLFALKGRSVEA
ncbi:MAG TPA: urea ABC transporter permease subunit UrtB [Afifellaceae bacterium]|nr:urea ABC transporter permease subunit UrtB [Afifellaceae bacterium]